MGAFRVGRSRPAQQLEVHRAELAKRAGRALVAADQRIRAATDELGFAEAGPGDAATSQLSETLAAARRHLSDAFRMNRLNHDAIPGSADEVRPRYLRIAELCSWVVDELAEQTSALAERMRRARRAPEVMPACERMPRRSAPESRTPARPSTTSPPATRPRLPPAGVNTDPLAHVSRVRAVRTALHAAITAARERAARPIPPVTEVHRAIEVADRQLDVARDAIAGHPCYIGAEALTRLAESERIRIDLGHSLGSSAATMTVTDQDHREQLIALARSVTNLASETVHLVRRDIDGRRRHVPCASQKP